MHMPLRAGPGLFRRSTISALCLFALCLFLAACVPPNAMREVPGGGFEIALGDYPTYQCFEGECFLIDREAGLMWGESRTHALPIPADLDLEATFIPLEQFVAMLRAVQANDQSYQPPQADPGPDGASGQGGTGGDTGGDTGGGSDGGSGGGSDGGSGGGTDGGSDAGGGTDGGGGTDTDGPT